MKAKFEKIYQEQKDTVYGYLYYMSRDEQTSLDLTQETFLKVYRTLDKFKGQCSEKTWCLTIARNTFLSYARKHKPLLLEEEAWASMADGSMGPEGEALKQEEVILMDKMCEQKEKVFKYLNGELPEQENAEMEEHINQCTRCSAMVEGYMAGTQSIVIPKQTFQGEDKGLVGRFMVHWHTLQGTREFLP